MSAKPEPCAGEHQAQPGYTVRGNADDIADLVTALGLEVQVCQAIAQRTRDARQWLDQMRHRGKT
jgi:hypothetical protein